MEWCRSIQQHAVQQFGENRVRHIAPSGVLQIRNDGNDNAYGRPITKKQREGIWHQGIASDRGNWKMLRIFANAQVCLWFPLWVSTIPSRVAVMIQAFIAPDQVVDFSAPRVLHSNCIEYAPLSRLRTVMEFLVCGLKPPNFLHGIFLHLRRAPPGFQKRSLSASGCCSTPCFPFHQVSWASTKDT